MSELFTYKGDDEHYFIKTKNKHYTGDEVVDLLNHLHQENQQLKHYKLYEDNKRLQTIIADLKEENEQLKREKAQLNERLRECYVRLDKYNCKW